MKINSLYGLFLAFFTHVSWCSTALGESLHSSAVRAKNLLQDIVTWDESSVFVHGERIILLAAEFHPFRLPSPDLWLDVFQKVRALGYSAVSFYLDWALLEGEPGQICFTGVFELDQFFDAAKESGIYLIARPGPYINAEVSGGGFPGWMGRLDGRFKTTDQTYLEAITPYILKSGSIIADAQITNGGSANNMTITGINSDCLEKEYMAYVEEQYRRAGIVVPFIFNDAFPVGNFAPETGVGAADLYSFDSYPLGWSTAPPNASDWSDLLSPLLLYNYTNFKKMSPSSPFSISEFQGGTPDAWGGVGVEASAAYIGCEFERVFYKLNYGYRIAIQTLYMFFGGTNWGNLGYPGGYTSYDIGAAITEDRQVSREKYSELKLQAGFLQASSLAYLNTVPDNGSYGVYTDNGLLATTRLAGNPTSFYVVRHGVLTSSDSQSYKLRLPTSIGNVSVPQLGGMLSLHGRDSKIHVVDYALGGINLIYSTAEVFTWKKSGSKSVVVLYGGENELHELAVPSTLGRPFLIEGNGLRVQRLSSAIVVQWTVQPSRRVVHFGNQLEVHLVWRNEAYNYWVLGLPMPDPINRYSSPSRENQSVIVQAGYLMRTAEITGQTLHLTGDINATTDIEIIAAPTPISSITFNNQKIKTTISKRTNRRHGTIPFHVPKLVLPDLTTLPWHYLDSLPEINPEYNDQTWIPCTHTSTTNPRNLTTPTSLYASDYTFNTGSLLYRGTFIANTSETSLYILTEGGFAYAHSIWLNSTHLASWPGSPDYMFYNQTLPLSGLLQPGQTYTITTLIDHMGNDENYPANVHTMKDPRGVIDYSLNGRDKEDITWKMTGNLGGEQYRDLSRGPLNEGGIFAERKGYHLPGAPVDDWGVRSPFEGIAGPGVGFFATEFGLDMPVGYDIPLSVVFTNTTSGFNSTTSTPAKFRSELFVNGWQFGKYINHIGPQTKFPIPEGILNYRGQNYLALTIWTTEDGPPLKLAGLHLEANAVIQSGYRRLGVVGGEVYRERVRSY